MMANTLVAYFSASGVTKGVAEKVAKAANADLFEIQPKTPYTKKDLSWINPLSRSSKEMKDPNSRVEIVGTVAEMEQYDTVYIGFPIWWYVAPHIINSFLEQYDFSGKTIHVFATSGSSGMGNTVAELKPSAPGAIFGKAQRMAGRVSQEEVDQWVHK
jgi:flavodoxin